MELNQFIGLAYDPPEGWKYGFPKTYQPKENETLEDTLRRDGYPEHLLKQGMANHCRFIGDPKPSTTKAEVNAKARQNYVDRSEQWLRDKGFRPDYWHDVYTKSDDGDKPYKIIDLMNQYAEYRLKANFPSPSITKGRIAEIVEGILQPITDYDVIHAIEKALREAGVRVE